MNENIADARLIATFHRSITMTVCVSALILCSAEGSLLPGAITPVVAIVAWLIFDENRPRFLPVIAANLLGMVALFAAGVEFLAGDIESKLLSGAHLIVYLTWIVLLLHKSPRQYWWLIALCLLHLAVSAVLTSAAGFGAALIGMLFLLLWTLSVFSLFRVFHHARAARGVFEEEPAAEEQLTGRVNHNGPRIRVFDGLQRDAEEPWIAIRFRGLVFLSFLVSLALSFIVFTAFPRVWVPSSPFASGNRDQGAQRNGIFHRTGFTETVQLGEIGNLLTSNGRVLQFSIKDIHTGKEVSAEQFANAMGMNEVRFRGNALGFYENGAWSRGLEERGYRRGEEESPRIGPDSSGLIADFRIDVSQDPPVSQFAFAVFPLTHAEATAGSGRILQRTVTGSLIWTSSTTIDKDAPRSFFLECQRPAGKVNLNFEHWTLPRLIDNVIASTALHRIRQYAKHIYITEEISSQIPSLHRISQECCSTSDLEELTASEKVERVMNYLSPDNGFKYSLSLTRQDEELDPVEDFLLNTKAGHCEYFASACTLMLQSVGVPARLVNGFYGSELNSLTGKNEVKQHHSHAWVEAFVDDQWITLDPVPDSDRQQAVASVKSNSLISDLQAALNDLWTGGMHNMTLDKQRAFFDPVIKIGKSVKENVSEKGVWEVTKAFFKGLFLSPGNWFSVQGAVVSFVLLLLVVALYRLHIPRRLLRITRALLKRFDRETIAAESIIRFYSAFRLLCEKHGLKFPAANTAIENAETAIRYFGMRLSTTDLQSAPMRIANAFNQVRFGDGHLDEVAMQRIAHDLSAIETALSGVHTNSASNS